MKEVTKEMDPNCVVPAYRLGRLFAVLERLQGLAIGNPNATITDRFYGAASTTPRVVFGNLLRLAQHHAAKIEGGGYFQKLIAEILEPLDCKNAFPASLPLEDQGLFALGYYHQRANLWKPREKKAEPQEAATA
jgi:CRISPR-associated protein Csd1